MLWYICFDIDCWYNLVHTWLSVVCVVPLELMLIMTYTPNHNVVDKVVSPVCRCDRCGQCLAYSITFSESLCGSHWDVKPCKEHFCCYVTTIMSFCPCNRCTMCTDSTVQHYRSAEFCLPPALLGVEGILYSCCPLGGVCLGCPHQFVRNVPSVLYC